VAGADPVAAPFRRASLLLVAIVVGATAPSILRCIAVIGVSFAVGAGVAAAASGGDPVVLWRGAVRLARADIGAIRIALRRMFTRRRFTLRIEGHRALLNGREVPIADLVVEVDGSRLDLGARGTFRMDQGLNELERFVLASALTHARRSLEARKGGAPPAALQRLRQPVGGPDG
jgi:hypothetical protein